MKRRSLLLRVIPTIALVLYLGWSWHLRSQRVEANELNSEGLALLRENRVEAALENFIQAGDRNPDAGGIWMNRALALELLERPEEALAAWRQAEVRGEAQATLGVVRTLRTLGQTDAARRALGRADDTLPGFARETGLLAYVEGDQDGARVWLEQALVDRPEDDIAREALAQLNGEAPSAQARGLLIPDEAPDEERSQAPE